MSIRVDESFVLRAPIDRVFHFLVDPRSVAACLPGAELTGQTDAVTYTGRITVKVGPVTVAYKGVVTLIAVDEDHHRVRLTGEGRETTGAGSAKLTMMSSMESVDPDRTSVHVEADLDLAGKLVTFGRGMIDSVNKQLFRQFVECLRSRLERPLSDAGATTTADPHVVASAVAGPAAPTHASGGGPTAAPVSVITLVFRAFTELVKRFRSPHLGRKTKSTR